MTTTAARAAEVLEEAARLATDDRPADAGMLALEGAALLAPHDPERYGAFVSAGVLLGVAHRHAKAADAWAAAAVDAPDDLARARALTAEGEAARLAGSWRRAVDAHQRSLAVIDVLDATSLDAAMVAQSLAVTFKYIGRFDEADSLFRRALAIAERHDDRRLIATVCHNLGGLAHARGAHAEGIPWARRAVHEREPLGDAVGLAADRGALAGLLVAVGRLDEARDLLTAARAVFVELLGVDHHEVAVVDGNLAAVALAAGELASAERHARAALRTKERYLGPEHPELGVTLTTLGTIRRRRGDHREAARLHRRALAVLRPAVERTHPLLRTIEHNLARAGR